MKPKHSITGKITALLLSLSLLSLLFAGAVSGWSLYSMKNVSVEYNRELGETAAADVEIALEKMAGEQLRHTAAEKAAYIEEKFYTIETYVRGIAQMAQDIYEEPENYPDRMVPLPVKGSRTLAPQRLWSRRIGTPTQKQWKELLKLGNMQDLLVQYNANNEMVSSTYLATKSGWMIQADYIAASKYSGDSALPDCYEAQERQWYQRALLADGGTCVYSDVIADIHEGTNCMVCAAPVVVQGETVAVAGVGSYLHTVSEAVLNTTIGENGYAFLLGRKGQVVVSPKTEGETAAGEMFDLRNGKNKKLAEITDKVLCGENGLQKVLLDGREVYLAYAPLPRLGWGFCTVMDVEEVIAPAVAGEQQILELSENVIKKQNEAIQKTFFLFAVLFTIAAVAVGLTGMIFGKQITKPIRRLTADVAKLGGGNMDCHIELKTGDELEELGNAFNRMTKQLRGYVANLAEITAEKERIQTELTLAANIQADMLPDGKNPFPGREEITLYASMTPAKEVGGDFYDFFFTDENHIALVVADVSGKGVPAALFMVVAKTVLRSHITTSETLAQSIEETNNLLCANNINDMFVTVWAGILDLCSGELTYVNAGHCRPLLCSDGAQYQYLTEKGGFVLGGIEGMKYRQHTIRLQPGDRMFQYSDGVVEANDAQGYLYGEECLKNFLTANSKIEPEALVKMLWEDIGEFQGAAGQFDDITMLALVYHGGLSSISRKPDQKHQPEVMDFVEHRLNGSVSETDAAKILVAVDEIYSNICNYSKAEESSVSCLVTADAVKITFTDNGMPYNPLKNPEPDVTADMEERPIGGLGIYIVKKTMDAVDYEYEYAEKKNRLTIIKKMEGNR